MVAREQTGWYVKVVEGAGDSLTDLLHRSDPWSRERLPEGSMPAMWDKDLVRKVQDSILIKKELHLWNMAQNLPGKRLREDLGWMYCRWRETEGDEEEDQAPHVGKTSRSVFERAREHTYSRDQMQNSSHMLKHIIQKHWEEEDPDNIQFDSPGVP